MILAKVLESIVHDQVYNYFESNNIQKEEQATQQHEQEHARHNP